MIERHALLLADSTISLHFAYLLLRKGGRIVFSETPINPRMDGLSPYLRKFIERIGKQSMLILELLQTRFVLS